MTLASFFTSQCSFDVMIWRLAWYLHLIFASSTFLEYFHISCSKILFFFFFYFFPPEEYMSKNSTQFDQNNGKYINYSACFMSVEKALRFNMMYFLTNEIHNPECLCMPYCPKLLLSQYSQYSWNIIVNVYLSETLLI